MAIAIATVVMLATAPAAPAAGVKRVGSAPTASIVYTADPGEANSILLLRFESGSGIYRFKDTASINAGDGCHRINDHKVDCDGASVSRILISTGDMNDSVRLGDADIGALGFACCTVSGGDGADNLNAHAVTQAGVVLNGEAGDDNLAGGASFDLLRGGAGLDTFAGNGGEDVVSYSDHTAAQPVFATLDGNPNDGTPGVDGNTAASGTGAEFIPADVEDVAGGLGNDTLIGNDLANSITGDFGVDRIQGAGGDDRMLANDAIQDVVACGAGKDIANVDLKDLPAGFPDCESVSQAAVDQHPTVEIKSGKLHLHGSKGDHFTRVRLKCPKSLSDGCKGQLVIKRGDATVGSKRYARIDAGDTTRVRIPVAEQFLPAIQKPGGIKARVAANELDSEGQAKLTLRTMKLVA